MATSLKSIRCTLLPLLVLAALAAIPLGCAGPVLVRSAPPALPFYEQPYCPGPGYIWIPGYWAYGQEGYFWVPGMWEYAPRVGWMWTPGYWGYSDDGLYIWHSGYWGRHIGFYGGINYGYGYTGVGFDGGYWRENNYYYNRSVTNVNVTVVHTTYQAVTLNKTSVKNAVSFTGGAAGIAATPTSAELNAAHDPHMAPTAHQREYLHAAAANRELLASENHGQPRAEFLAKWAARAAAKKKNKVAKVKRQKKSGRQDQRRRARKDTDSGHVETAPQS